MKSAKLRLTLALILSVWLTLAGLTVGVRTQAQNTNVTNTTSTTDENTPQNTNEGPVRMAHIAYVEGDVSWRPDAQTDWATASINLPLRQGAEIWANNNATVELQFDDGSRLRLRNGIITLQTLYSDTQGEFTEITQDQGLSYLALRTDHSLYQVNTPFASVKASGPGKIRVGVADAVDIAVREGSAAVQGAQGQVMLNAGDYLGLRNANSAYNVRALPPADGWDRFNMDRDSQMDARNTEHLPPNVAIAAGNLDAYGNWVNDPNYGWVWTPSVSPTWQPYYDGNWVWCEPFGWTWCGVEPWGWAPYHYGSWFHARYGWAWCPGPVNQYWCPGAVSFCYGGGGIGWCPLAPWEMRYPATLGIGFGYGNWSLFFSIGGCAAYYPNGYGFFGPHPWGAGWVNRFRWDNNFNHFSEFNHNAFVHNGYVPANARWGGAFASTAAFGGHGGYRPLGANGSSFFAHGQMVGAPSPGSRAFSGPSEARVSAASFSASRQVRSDLHLPSSIANRSVYRAPVASNISRNSAPFRSSVRTPGSSPALRGGTLGGSRSSFTPGNFSRGASGFRYGGSGSPAERAAQARSSLERAGIGSYRNGQFSNNAFGRDAFGRGNSAFGRGAYNGTNGYSGRSNAGYSGGYHSYGYSGSQGRSNTWNRGYSGNRSSYSPGSYGRSGGSYSRGSGNSGNYSRGSGYSGGSSHGSGYSGGGRSSGGSSGNSSRK